MQIIKRIINEFLEFTTFEKVFTISVIVSLIVSLVYFNHPMSAIFAWMAAWIVIYVLILFPMAIFYMGKDLKNDCDDQMEGDK